MRVLGFDITRSTPIVETSSTELVEKQTPPGAQVVGGSSRFFSSLWGYISEPFTGAWQRNMEIESTENLLAFPAVRACVRLISSDIAKLRPKLVREESSGITTEIKEASPFLPVLRKPNAFQNRIQFFKHWMISKLLYGNTYVLKGRDDRNVVNRLYVLDPQLVSVLVTDDGGIYYELKVDTLSRVGERVVVPASEIIHDRAETLWHPLIGVSPLFSAAMAATQGLRIQSNSAKFFENMSRPSGVLTSPNAISAETAKRLKESFEANFSGSNIGRLLVGGDGLKYEAMTIPATDAQLVEQLNWTGIIIASVFGVPPHKIGLGPPPTFNNIGQLNQQYYNECLQELIESIELCLDEGLGLTAIGYGVELDLEGLLRLDPVTRTEIAAKRIQAGYSSPNEERLIENRGPVEGGDTPFMQQQMFPLKLLAKRTFQDVPAKPGAPQKPSAAPAAPAASDEEAARQLTIELINRFYEVA